MKVQLFAIFLLFSLFSQYSFSDEVFVHVVGYKILANPLYSPKTLNVYDCATDCIQNYRQCIGFKHTPEDNACQLLTMIRNIVPDSPGCYFYVMDRTFKYRGDPNMEKLNPVDQLIYANFYM